MARGRTWRHAALSAVPLLGTAASGGVAVLASGDSIVRASHYRGKTIFEAFDPVHGALNSLRTLADNQIPGTLGIWSKQAVLPWPAALLVVVGLVVLGYMWWRLAPRHPLFLLGLAVIVGSDLLVYGARADWSYERSVHNWTRYHLFPHLGLVLFIVGGLPRLTGRMFSVSESDLSRRQVLALGGLLALLTCCHWPRTHWQHLAVPPEQKAVLERIERVDAVCRIERIDGATARAALGFVHFPLGYDRANAWELLRGSPSPVPVSVDAARSLLASMR